MDLILEASFFYSKYFHNQSKVYLRHPVSIKEDDMDQMHYATSWIPDKLKN